MNTPLIEVHRPACLANDFSAIKYYQEASKACPSDPTPLSNLSAALYETGQYGRCILEIETALRLAASNNNADQVLIHKLKTRQCKAYITLGHLHKAIEVVRDDKEPAEGHAVSWMRCSEWPRLLHDQVAAE